MISSNVACPGCAVRDAIFRLLRKLVEGKRPTKELLALLERWPGAPGGTGVP